MARQVVLTIGPPLAPAHYAVTAIDPIGLTDSATETVNALDTSTYSDTYVDVY